MYTLVTGGVITDFTHFQLHQEKKHLGLLFAHWAS